MQSTKRKHDARIHIVIIRVLSGNCEISKFQQGNGNAVNRKYNAGVIIIHPSPVVCNDLSENSASREICDEGEEGDGICCLNSNNVLYQLALLVAPNSTSLYDDIKGLEYIWKIIFTNTKEEKRNMFYWYRLVDATLLRISEMKLKYFLGKKNRNRSQLIE